MCNRGGRKFKSEGKGLRKRGASQKVGCQWTVETMEDMRSGVTEITKSNTIHTYPCVPSNTQLLTARQKSGRNFRAIPMEVFQRVAGWIQCKVQTQSLRMNLELDPDFPKTITTDAQFMRNLRLFIKLHGITPNRSANPELQNKAVDYEEIM